MFEDITCKHKEQCSDHPKLCYICKHNTGKRSYYQPYQEPEPYIPWYPWIKDCDGTSTLITYGW